MAVEKKRKQLTTFELQEEMFKRRLEEFKRSGGLSIEEIVEQKSKVHNND